MRLVIIMAFAAFSAACNLPAIPIFGDTGDEDVRPEEDMTLPGEVCEPNSRLCLASSVRVCSADGRDFAIEPCKSGETCAVGQCLTIENTCNQGQPFALSVSEINFDTPDGFKSQSRDITLSNCGDRAFVVRDAIVRGPDRPDGDPVFTLASAVANAPIEPGDEIDFKIIFHPVPGLNQVTGKLELTLITDEIVNVEIPLRSTTFCATTTPIVDLGVVSPDTPQIGVATVQNCGSEPLTFKAATTSIPNLSVTPGEPIGHIVEAGESFTIDVTLDTPDTGFVEGSIVVQFEEDLDQVPRIDVAAFVAQTDCEDLVIPPVQVLVNNQLQPPTPGSLVRTRFENPPAPIEPYVRLLSQPDRSHESIERTGQGWVIQPRIVGDYVLRVFAIDNGVNKISCASEPLTLEVRPQAPLLFELAWSSVGDQIPGDVGFARAVNLDLHVLSTTEGQGKWNVPTDDCYPGAASPCGEGIGQVVQSQGGTGEFVRFAEVDGVTFEAGVYLSNPFNFTGVDARIRVYRDGALTEEVFTENLQTADDFWLVGLLDPSGDWLEIDRTFSGFPR